MIELDPFKVTSDRSEYGIAPYIYGILYEYSREDIRGYYLRRYILYYLPDKIKTPLEAIEGVNKELYVQPEEHYNKRYDYVKKYDGFADFDTKFLEIEKKALSMIKKISESKKFKEFIKKHISDLISFSTT
jgi:hypothetical protein